MQIRSNLKEKGNIALTAVKQLLAIFNPTYEICVIWIPIYKWVRTQKVSEYKNNICGIGNKMISIGISN